MATIFLNEHNIYTRDTSVGSYLLIETDTELFRKLIDDPFALYTDERDIISLSRYHVRGAVRVKVHAVVGENGAILPQSINNVLRYVEDYRTDMYKGKVTVLAATSSGELKIDHAITSAPRHQEALVVVGGPETTVRICGDVSVRTLVVLGCNLIVEGDITATDHIYAYARSISANRAIGGLDVIYVSDAKWNYSSKDSHSTIVFTEGKTEVPKFDTMVFCSVISGMRMAQWLTDDEAKVLKERWDEINNAPNMSPIPLALPAAQQQSSNSESGLKVRVLTADDVMDWIWNPNTSIDDVKRFATLLGVDTRKCSGDDEILDRVDNAANQLDLSGEAKRLTSAYVNLKKGLRRREQRAKELAAKAKTAPQQSSTDQATTEATAQSQSADPATIK